jgi:hypothetical protein
MEGKTMPSNRKRSKTLGTAAAARELGVSPPMILKLVSLGFLSKPYTPAELRAAWAKWEKDKAARAAVRATPTMLDEADRTEKIRGLELGNEVKTHTLLRMDFVTTGVEVALGPVKADAETIVRRGVSDGGDRHELETIIDGALARASARFGEACDALRANPAQDGPARIELPHPDSVEPKAREKIGRIVKRRLANDELEAKHIAATTTFDMIAVMVETVEKAFTGVPDAPLFVIDPLKARAASVIECLRNGLDPESLS